MTFRLGEMSQERLEGIDLDLARCVRRAIEVSSQDFSVFEGLRNLERQKELFAAGASRTLDSYHLPDSKGIGRAVDLVPFIGGRVQWQSGPCLVVARAMLFAAQQFAVPLTWGGVWDRPLTSLDQDDLEGEVARYVDAFRTATGHRPLVDLPHFQVPR